LLRDLKGAKELSTTLAGRVTDYSQSGIVYMWKTGLNWSVNDSVRVRGTVSADTRAPNVVELFNSAQISRGTYTAPWNRLVSLQGQNVTTGNPNLTPEDAKTITAGFVFTPVNLPGFQASLDWYKISLLGSIGAPGGQDVIDRCSNGDQEYCAMLVINGQRVTGIAQTLTTADFIEARLANQNEETNVYTSGLDFEANYRMPLAGGNLNLRLTGLYLLDDYNANNGCAPGALGKKSDLVGAIGVCGVNPKIRARLAANYTIGRFGINVQERYTHSGLRNPNYLEGFDISDNTVPAIAYTDMTFKYGLESLFGAAGEVYLNVTNVFDKDPPPTNSTAGRSWIDPTEQEVYDLLGRRFVLGMRLNW
jgi:outer membrane receptor protein involved in Fe transport